MTKVATKLSDLTPEQKQQLFDEMQAEQRLKDEAKQNNRKAYKDLVNETIPRIYTQLKEASAALAFAKKYTYDQVKELLALKTEVFGNDAEQLSHSFSTADGITLIIGNRTTDGWDDTVNVGIAKVNKCLESFVKDENSRALVKSMRRLLQRDTKGNLKATRVFELRQLADDSKNEELIEAIDIIQKAHQPNRSKQFVTLRYKNVKGIFIDLPLSITDAEITEEKQSDPVI